MSGEAEAPRAATPHDAVDSSQRDIEAAERTTSPAPAADDAAAVAVDPASSLSALSLSVPAASAAPTAELSPCSRAPHVPTVTIKLHAAGHTRRFRLPSTCSFSDLRAEVAELCKLHTQDFRIQFKVSRDAQRSGACNRTQIVRAHFTISRAAAMCLFCRQVGEEDRVMSSDACVALAFAPALADGTPAAATPGGPAVNGKPVRLSVELIGRVPSANSARVSWTRRKPPLASAAAVPGSAGAASCVSESAGSSAVALAQAAISMSVAPAPLPINAAPSSVSASSSAAAAAVPEVSPAMDSAVEAADKRQERAAARVRSLLSHPHATWTLEAVQQAMRDSGMEDDALLLPLVTPAMLSAQMDLIVQQRSLDAALCASVAFNPTPLPPLPAQPPVAFVPSSISSSSSSSSRASKEPRKWACSLCSYLNVEALKRCQMCTAEKVEAAIVPPSAPSRDNQPQSPSAPQPPVLSADAPPFEPVFRVRAPVVESKAAEASAPPAIVSPQPVAAAEPSAPSADAAPVSVSITAPESVVSAPVVLSADAPEVIRPLSPAVAPAASDPAPSDSSSSASTSVSSLASPVSSSSISSTLPASPSTLELQQLREQLARMSEQMAQLLATQSSVSAGGSPSCSLTASAFGAPATTVVPPSLAASSAAPAPAGDSVVAAQLAQLLELQHARFVEMEKSQQALQAKVLEMERQKLNRKRSGSVKTFAGAGAGGAAIAKHRQRSLSGVRSSKPGTQWGSGSLSSSQHSSPLSTSVPASPMITSVHSSPGATPQAAPAAMPTLDLQPPLSASSASATPHLTSHASPAILGSDLDLSAYVKLSCLSELDLTAVTESPATSQLITAIGDADRASSSLPPRAPILATIHSCSELEAAAAEEGRIATAVPAVSPSPAASTASPAPSPSAALSAIPESNSTSPEAAVASSSSSLAAQPSAIAASSTSASSLSPSCADLSVSSADLRDDVRFPSVPDVRDREPKLDELAQMGFTNRIFASMLLDMHQGDMTATIADLKQFYGTQN